jgi:exodeoxyribonuclease VII large subunit
VRDGQEGAVRALAAAIGADVPDPRREPPGIPGPTSPGRGRSASYAAGCASACAVSRSVQVFGEVFGFKVGRAPVWFELRDALGACRARCGGGDFDALRERPADGAQVVAAGGCDFYPARAPRRRLLLRRVGHPHRRRGRPAGPARRAAPAARSRGLFEPQKRLPRPALPRCIGVVTGEGGKARDDVLAGLRRRGWAGRVVWAFAPVQDRHAAPAVTRALQDLAPARRWR